ncbi:hypothetical protein PUNSTDRAFT_118715 [Punctularia strigosozonata HHB-11173 SS5]|uniref:uncharacterized protein n=1 Tax=Punctularia strigosozonata (strain HHB-11173) TaxID=741275 RepID=UPI00044165C5|nr:uncharacterized protein PUNSTDRAFT_118715 [Punctularia strigosozonata HHB-11173 SS5]EIN11207.1 hypothetical protein PUNSTDRAFT_118715 [Punctularia strigosozonata HHB-11173 SS5]
MHHTTAQATYVVAGNPANSEPDPRIRASGVGQAFKVGLGTTHLLHTAYVFADPFDYRIPTQIKRASDLLTLMSADPLDASGVPGALQRSLLPPRRKKCNAQVPAGPASQCSGTMQMTDPYPCAFIA